MYPISNPSAEPGRRQSVAPSDSIECVFGRPGLAERAALLKTPALPAACLFLAVIGTYAGMDPALSYATDPLAQLRQIERDLATLPTPVRPEDNLVETTTLRPAAEQSPIKQRRNDRSQPGVGLTEAPAARSAPPPPAVNPEARGPILSIKRAPTPAHVRSSRQLQVEGLRQMRQGQSMAALDSLRRAQALDPRSFDALYNLAVGLDRAGLTRQARQRYTQAMRLARTSAHQFSLQPLRSRLAQLDRSARHGR